MGKRERGDAWGTSYAEFGRGEGSLQRGRIARIGELARRLPAAAPTQRQPGHGPRARTASHVAKAGATLTLAPSGAKFTSERLPCIDSSRFSCNNASNNSPRLHVQTLRYSLFFTQYSTSTSGTLLLE